jgi:hypothetical protein
MIKELNLHTLKAFGSRVFTFVVENGTGTFSREG